MKNSEEQNIEHIIRRMLTDRSVDAPRDAVTYARNLYRTRALEPKASIVRRVLAVMQVDLAPNRAAFGERSSSSSQARQMLFESGDNAVDLRVTAVDDKFDIRGQILGEGFENGEIEITGVQLKVRVKIDKASSFSVSELAAGEYDLTITGKNTEIQIDKINIK
ncbi:MAG: hypothetical protein IPL32_08750 [Chloracidobacterium sp.]|nr:hypothetical protein [Chloracidobacterium sp.]